MLGGGSWIDPPLIGVRPAQAKSNSTGDALR